MNSYYYPLPTIKINFNENKSGKEIEIFEHAEYTHSGDFIIVFQEGIKTVIPMVKIDTIEVPYGTTES